MHALKILFDSLIIYHPNAFFFGILSTLISLFFLSILLVVACVMVILHAFIAVRTKRIKTKTILSLFVTIYYLFNELSQSIENFFVRIVKALEKELFVKEE